MEMTDCMWHQMSCNCSLFITAQHTGFVLVGQYSASNFNCLQSGSNVGLDVEVQEPLPAVEMNCLL